MKQFMISLAAVGLLIGSGSLAQAGGGKSGSKGSSGKNSGSWKSNSGNSHTTNFKKDHDFKKVSDEETKRALFPSNYPPAA